MQALYIFVFYADDYPKHERNIGTQAPPLTELVKKILYRYSEGGQILKV